MKKHTKTNKYLIVLSIFFIVFLVSMTYLLPKLYDEIDMYRYSTLKKRLEMAQSDEEYLYLSNMAQRYLLNGNYESEFDKYWEFAQIESTYMQACTLKRAILEGDTSQKDYFDECLQRIQNYIDTQNTPTLQNSAKSFLKDLLS